ncbi:MAG: ribonuclease H [Actinomyces sp.]|uniref:ribonuclease H n=1 Tax=Actinomyces sp. TaxID=29317 RepID=UPI002903C4BB|nr:ribonuclease H [Actinomyces sp.]MDU2258752.1 ribonuclease H [Actinomyces sp.]
MTITAAVDGSSLGNPGPAGWAWVISEDCWDAGGWPSGTNNLGELNAVLELLNATAQAGLADEDLHILADSQYAINVISKWSPEWKKRGWVKADKKPIKNLELIQEIDRAMQGRTVTFEWVKGHAGHPLNERADDAARSCAEAYRDGRTIPHGPGFVITDSTEQDTATSKTDVASTNTESASTEFEPAAPAADSASAGRKIPENATDMAITEEALERQFLDAWLRADSQALKALQAPGCMRIWHNGSLTQGLEGRAPEHAESSNFQVNHLHGTSTHHDTAESYPDAWVITYVLTWTGGKLRESSTWVAGENGPRILMHQSSPISAR